MQWHTTGQSQLYFERNKVETIPSELITEKGIAKNDIEVFSICLSGSLVLVAVKNR
jgi:hypothetical protein